MANQNDPSVQGLAKNRSKWQLACDLLDSGQYEHVARLLRGLQATSEQVADGILDDLLVAAYQICLACRQCAAEKKWHLQAGEQSRQREQELRQTLGAILELFSKSEMGTEIRVEESVRSFAEAAELGQLEQIRETQPNLWQRLQGWLGWGTAAQLPKRPLVEVTGEPDDEEIALPVSIKIDGQNKPERQSSTTSASLVVYCLGPFRAYQNGKLLENCSSRKGQSLFKYLVTHHLSAVSTEILMDTFWPEANPQAARRNLHQAIYALRQTLKANDPDFQYIQFENDGYVLNPDLRIRLDCDELEQHVQAGRELERRQAVDQAIEQYGIAEGLYKGDFMTDELYEDWPGPHRQHLWQTYLWVVYRLTEYYLARGEYAAVIALSERILTMDNCQEKAHQNLIKCYLAQGQRYLALHQFHLCVEALKTELDLPPSAEIRSLYDQIATG